MGALAKILEWLYTGGKEAIKAEGLNAAFFGPQGVMMDVIAGGLKMIEPTLKKLDPQFSIGAEDFTPFGALGYWNKVYSEISTINKGLGITGNLGLAMKTQFKDAFIALADVGIEQKEIATNVKTFMEDYGRAMILSTQEMVNMSQMADIFGVESLAIVSSYKDLGLSIETTTARMKKLTLESNKYGVLPSRAVKLIKENLSAVDKYYFKGGTKAFEHMALKAASLNNDMKGAFTMIDKILDGGIEGAVEMAQEFQIMGGPIAQMGDVFGLIQKALSGDVEGFTNDMAKAAAQMATINSEGEIMFDPAAMMQFRQLAVKTGVDIQEITKLGRAMAKEMDISKQLDLSLKSTPEKFAEMTKKVAGAVKGKNAFGDWVVTIDGIEKKVQDLTEEDINAKLSISPEGDEKDTFKELIRSNMDLGDILKTLVAEIKKTALGGAGAAYQELLPIIKQIADTGADTIKEYAQSFSDMSEIAYERLGDVLNPLAQGDLTGAFNAAFTNVTDTLSTFWNMIKGAVYEVGKVIGNALWNAYQYIVAGFFYGVDYLIFSLKKGLFEAANTIVATIIGPILARFNIKPNLIDTSTMEMDSFSDWMKKNKYEIVDVFKDFDWGNIIDPIFKRAEEKYKPIPGLSEEASKFIRNMIPDEGEKVKTTVDNKQYLEVKGEIFLINADGSKVPLTEEQIRELVKNLMMGNYRTTPNP
jgi:hypothetical protein